MIKRTKEGKQHKRRQEKREKRKRTQNKMQNASILCPKPKAKENAHGNNKTLPSTGNYGRREFCNNPRLKLELSKWGKKTM